MKSTRRQIMVCLTALVALITVALTGVAAAPSPCAETHVVGRELVVLADAIERLRNAQNKARHLYGDALRAYWDALREYEALSDPELYPRLFYPDWEDLKEEAQRWREAGRPEVAEALEDARLSTEDEWAELLDAVRQLTGINADLREARERQRTLEERLPGLRRECFLSTLPSQGDWEPPPDDWPYRLQEEMADPIGSEHEDPRDAVVVEVDGNTAQGDDEAIPEHDPKEPPVSDEESTNEIVEVTPSQDWKAHPYWHKPQGHVTGRPLKRRPIRGVPQRVERAPKRPAKPGPSQPTDTNTSAAPMETPSYTGPATSSSFTTPVQHGGGSQGSTARSTPAPDYRPNPGSQTRVPVHRLRRAPAKGPK